MFFGIGAIAAMALAAALLLVGFALSGMWPGLSWAIGGGLALVAIVAGARWLRAAVTGESPARPADAADHRGAI